MVLEDRGDGSGSGSGGSYRNEGINKYHVTPPTRTVHRLVDSPSLRLLSLSSSTSFSTQSIEISNLSID